jgi:opacity protein-like surface antigen
MKLGLLRKRCGIIALGAAAFGASAPAAAAELGFYVAGFYGQSKISGADKAELDALAAGIYADNSFTPEVTDSSLGDDKDSSFGMTAGYRLFANLAIEGGYSDLGKIAYRNSSFGTHVDHQEPWFQKLSFSTSGITLSALGILPVSYSWEVYARAGVMFATNEIDLYISDSVSALSAQASDSSTEWLAGVGASYSFAEVYGLRFEFQRILDAGEGLVEGDTDVLSIGVTVTF